MSRKQSLRRTVAGILAVLTVTGNLIAPTQIRIPFSPENAITAEASKIVPSAYTWDSSTGTLTITGNVELSYPNNANNNQDEVLNIYTSNNTGWFADQIDKSDVKHVIIASTAVLPSNCQAMFQEYSNLEDVVFAEYVDGTNIRKMSAMFQNCSKLKSVDMSGLINTQNLEYIDNIFDGCTSLTSLDISNIDGSKMCQGQWRYSRVEQYQTGQLYHPAIDALKEAVKNCNQMSDLNISPEFLDHCLINARANTANSTNGSVTIEDVVDSLLSGNPNAATFRQQLLDAYQAWYDSTYRTDIRDAVVSGAEGKEYDGTPVSFSVTYNGTVLTEGTDYTITFKRDGLTEVDSVKDAGIYSYTVEGINDYREKITGNVVVSPRTAELTWGVSSFFYDGNTHCPTAGVGNLVEGDECEVTVTGGSKGSRRDTYNGTARATALSNPNYALPSNVTHPYTIYHNELTGITATGFEGDYDQAAHGITVNLGSNTGVAVTYGLNENDIESFTAEQPSLVDAGTYTVFYRVTKDTYADFIGSATVTINPIAADIVWGDVTSFVYNGSAQAPTATATGLLDGDTSDVVIEGAATDVGSHTATATGFTNGNYFLPEPSSKDFTITAAELGDISAQGYTGTYDGAEHTISVTAPDGAAVTYSDTEDGEYSETAPTLTDAGSKTVYYKVSKPNYNDVYGNAVITIAPRTLAVTWGDTEFTYDGTEKCPEATLDTANVVEGETVEVNVDGAQVNAGDSYTATASLSSTNYVLPEDQASCDFLIAKAVAQITWTNTDLTYTGSAQAPTATLSGLIGEDTCEVTVEGAEKNAGDSYTATASLTNENYTIQEDQASCPFSIAQLEAQLSWTDTDLTYNGEEQAPKATVSNLVEGDSCDVTVTGGQTVAGEYVAAATELSNANYKLPENATQAFTIKAASMEDVTAVGYTGTYDGEAHGITV
ncbi:MAG: BspA family leucine-rich repeat surface protein, partial [Oscillospiraceae bacterium]|nr:BspA family leucine-rich repeat surface protein [Oscillospiraceae bacterium]